ncbi:MULTISPECIES: hypothetical protein [Vibrionaceae]|uniref:Uncharacterized protein n=1 Tax=bacterium 19MO02SH05 TaxID=2920696 RepID=A0AAU6TM66_UNCXX|nr:MULTISPECIES: hypothetical protein [Vibrionaceae]EJG0995308.1 hypothetical protein [Vibrio parahaemolyticus]EKO3766308.1 hypothetical protein [Vibrio metschnikovii]EKF9435232.1 hypothetical protein [Vibrio cholerae]EKO3767945.1 hypothetical protein [Vibrio metschnikovii]ELH8889502.1 hypothetical protein [Vibrio cholerae]
MKLEKILHEEFNRRQKMDNPPKDYREMIVRSLKEIESTPFFRKGKVDYAFSNEIVEI